MGRSVRSPINPKAEIHLYGQEVNPETWAVSKSDLFMKDPTGKDADNIGFGSTLSNDRHSSMDFDYLIANPPYGKDWKRDEESVTAEHERGAGGRFAPGLPRISDGQLLFLLHMLAHAKDPKDGGSRIAIIMNGSPLFTGDARQRRERDPPLRAGERSAGGDDRPARAALLQHRHRYLHLGRHEPQGPCASQESPAHRRLGLLGVPAQEPRRQTARDPEDREADILKLLAAFKDGETRKLVEDGSRRRGRGQPHLPDHTFRLPQDHRRAAPASQFPGQPRTHRPSGEEKGFQTLAQSKKKGAAGAKEEAEGRAQQEAIRNLLRSMKDDALQEPRGVRRSTLDEAAASAGYKLGTSTRKAILSALSERDEGAEICRDEEGNPEPDPELRDNESVPLDEAVHAFFAREVTPHLPDAWIDESRLDPKDGKVGLRRLRDQLQPLFLSLQAAAPAGGDRCGHQGGRSRYRRHARRSDRERPVTQKVGIIDRDAVVLRVAF